MRYWNLELNLLEILLETWKSSSILTTRIDSFFDFWVPQAFFHWSDIYVLHSCELSKRCLQILLNSSCVHLSSVLHPSLRADTVGSGDKWDGQSEKADVWSRRGLDGWGLRCEPGKRVKDSGFQGHVVCRSAQHWGQKHWEGILE